MPAPVKHIVVQLAAPHRELNLTRPIRGEELFVNEPCTLEAQLAGPGIYAVVWSAYVTPANTLLFRTSAPVARLKDTLVSALQYTFKDPNFGSSSGPWEQKVRLRAEVESVLDANGKPLAAEANFVVRYRAPEASIELPETIGHFDAPIHFRLNFHQPCGSADLAPLSIAWQFPGNVRVDGTNSNPARILGVRGTVKIRAEIQPHGFAALSREIVFDIPVSPPRIASIGTVTNHQEAGLFSFGRFLPGLFKRNYTSGDTVTLGTGHRRRRRHGLDTRRRKDVEHAAKFRFQTALAGHFSIRLRGSWSARCPWNGEFRQGFHRAQILARVGSHGRRLARASLLPMGTPPDSSGARKQRRAGLASAHLQ